jgi:hypothetical protein
MMDGADLFSHFAEMIRGLPDGGLTDEHLLQFRVHADPSIRVYFAPFEWVNTRARIAIVGITPGRASMARAFLAARNALVEGATFEEASQMGKQTGSFSNMRDILSYRLDAIGIHQALGINSTAQLFGDRADLLHCTSCVRYPVFAWSKKKQKWENYGGYSPRTPAKHPMLNLYVKGPLSNEMSQLRQALVVPLGTAVSEALRAAGVDEKRCLFGFPHASNGKGAKERADAFERMKDDLRGQVASWHSMI